MIQNKDNYKHLQAQNLYIHIMLHNVYHLSFFFLVTLELAHIQDLNQIHSGPLHICNLSLEKAKQRNKTHHHEKPLKISLLQLPIRAIIKIKTTCTIQ